MMEIHNYNNVTSIYTLKLFHRVYGVYVGVRGRRKIIGRLVNG